MYFSKFAVLVVAQCIVATTLAVKLKTGSEESSLLGVFQRQGMFTVLDEAVADSGANNDETFAKKKKGTYWIEPGSGDSGDGSGESSGPINLLPPECVAQQLKLSQPPHSKLVVHQNVNKGVVVYKAEGKKTWSSDRIFDVISETLRGITRYEAVVRPGVSAVFEVEGSDSDNWEEKFAEFSLLNKNGQKMLTAATDFVLPHPPRVNRQKFFVTVPLESCHYKRRYSNEFSMIEMKISPAIKVNNFWICENSPAKNARLLGDKLNLGAQCPDASGINPTCQPLNFRLNPVYDIPQMRFLWEPGCSEGHAFQVSRTYSNHHGHKVTQMIGEDFEHMFERPAPDNVCSVDISPEAQLVDDDANALITFGAKQTYCLNTLIHTEDKSVMASTKTCTSFKPEWRGRIGGHIEEEDGNQGIEGVIVGAAYCEAEELVNGLCYGNKELSRPYYDKLSQLTTQEFTSTLKEGDTVVFDTSSKNKELISNARVGRDCPAKDTSAFLHLIKDVPDFEIKIEGNAADLGYDDPPPQFQTGSSGHSVVHIETRLFWSRKFPRCWFHVDQSNNLIRTMTHEAREDADGFDRHFEIRAVPGWRWMANNCRLACNLCSGIDCVNNKADSVCDSWANDARDLCPRAGEQLKTNVYFEGRNSRDVEERVNQYGTIVQGSSNCFPGWQSSVAEYEYAFMDREGAVFYPIRMNRRNEITDKFVKNMNRRINKLHEDARAMADHAAAEQYRDDHIKEIRTDHERFEKNILWPPAFDHYTAQALRADVDLKKTIKVFGLKLRALSGLPKVGDIELSYKHAVTGKILTIPLSQKSGTLQTDTKYYYLDEPILTDTLQIQPMTWDKDAKQPERTGAWFSVEVLVGAGIKCCVGNTPVVWNECDKMFTVCPSPAVITSGSAEQKATQMIEIVSWSASGMHDGKETPSKPFKIRGTATKISFAYFQEWEIEIFNIFGGNIEKYDSTRTNNDGNVELKVSSVKHIRDLIRPVRILPFFTSELHSKVLVNFEHKFRAMSRDSSGYKALISADPILGQFRPANPFNPKRNECSLDKKDLQILHAAGLGLHRTPKLVQGEKSSFRWGGMEHAEQVNPEEFTGVTVDTPNGLCYLEPSNEMLLIGPIADNLQDPVMMFKAVNELMPKLPATTLTDGSEPGIAMIADESIVSIETRIGYHGTKGFCPVSGLMFCAYFLDEDKRPMVVPTQQVLDSCAITDENGLAIVKVPFGSHVGIVYGCQTSDQNQECAEDEATRNIPNFDTKIGRTIRLAFGHTDILLGATPEHTVEFQDMSKHPVYVLTGAGPYLPLKEDVDEPLLMVEEQRCFYQMKEAANHLFIHPTKPECSLDPDTPMQYKLTKDNRVQIHRVPHDITMEYQVMLQAKKTAIEILNEFFESKLMPINRVPLLTTLEKPRVVVFEYRVVPEISLELKDAAGVLKEQEQCKTDHFDFVIEQVVSNKPNNLEVTASILEQFGADLLMEGEKECELPNGLVKFSDAVAASATMRKLRAGDNGDYRHCSLAGCIAPISQDEKAKPGVRNARYTIDQISPPEREAPWTKILAAKFEPEKGSTALPRLRYARILVLGEVPLTAHQTINMPEYIPFLILRDPPGSDSTSHWSKDTAVELDVSFTLQKADGTSIAIAGGIGTEQEVSAQTGFDLPFGGPLVEFGLPEFKLSAERKIGHEHVFGGDKVVSLGNTVTLSAVTSYETSDYNGNIGTSSDLFVTPALSLRILTSLLVSLGDLDKCEVLNDEVTRWNLLEGSAKDNVDAVLARNTPNLGGGDSATVASSSNDEDARKEATAFAQAAIHDKEWNSVSVHSEFDIIALRIPQLQKVCIEITRFLQRCGPHSQYVNLDVSMSGSEIFGSSVGFSSVKEKDVKELDSISIPTIASIEKVCGELPSEPIGERVCEVYRISNDNKPVSAAGLALRLRSSYVSIAGWRKALYLNEHLKTVARENHPMNPREMIGSPLLVGQQELGTGASSVVGDSDVDIKSDLQGNVHTAMDKGMNALHKISAMGSDVPLDEDDITKGSRFYSDGADISNAESDASVISFTGASSRFSYEVESSSTHGLSLSLMSVEDADTNFEDEFSLEFVATLEIGLDLHILKSGSKEATKTSTESTGSAFGFTLKDGMLGNLFDVKVSRDPVYGTPVFHTLGGRSACSHNAGTDARDQHKIRFATNLSLKNKGEGQVPGSSLDGQSGEDIRDVAVHYDKDKHPCATTLVVIEDLDPYHGGWEYYLRLDDVNGRGLTGIMTTFNGEDFQGRFVIGPYAPGSTVQQIDFCPVDDHVIERTGGVYHNIDIIIESACESDMANNEGLAKYASETVDNPAPTCDTYKSNQCRNTVFEEGDYRIVEESLLHNRITIRCLSFIGPEGCGIGGGTTASEVQLSSKSNLRGSRE